jgi:hypothetical protein
MERRNRTQYINCARVCVCVCARARAGPDDLTLGFFLYYSAEEALIKVKNIEKQLRGVTKGWAARKGCVARRGPVKRR